MSALDLDKLQALYETAHSKGGVAVVPLTIGILRKLRAGRALRDELQRLIDDVRASRAGGLQTNGGLPPLATCPPSDLRALDRMLVAYDAATKGEP